jgi:CheY-like chemotaxis protein
VQHVGRIPDAVLSDPIRIRQILVNLVGNAIKFTEIGSVQVTLRLADAAAGLPDLTFDVSDTGIGISPQHVAELFQPFAQAESSTTRKYGGSGLGLSISKRLANMLGGDIVVTSRLGEGSTFSLSLPVQIQAPDNSPSRPERQEWSADAPFPLLDRRILLVDDGPDNQRLIAFLLKEAGADVVLANNGRTAVEIVMSPDESFDAILMDMQMPIMDGYEATKALRDAAYDGPIIALTACAMCDDVKKCLAAGCSGYLSKPVDRVTLISTLAQYAASHGRHRPPACSVR